MKHFLQPLFCSLLVAQIIGCAHQSQAPISLTEEQVERINKEALELASQRLEKMVAESKQQGPESVQYLSTSLFLKGNSALMEGDHVTGAVLFKHLAQLTDDPFVHKKYAVALIRLGEMEEARNVLQRLHEQLKAKDEGVALILAGVYAAIDQAPEARKVYRQILATNPRQEEACLFLGKSLAVEKKWSEAEAQLNKCQAAHATNGIFSYYLGKMHVDRGNLKAAVRAFEAAHKRDPSSSQAAAALGLIYEQWEQADQAIAVYKRHLEKKPQDAAILNRLVQALFLKERFTEVIPYAERLVDLDPEDLNLRVKLGILYTDAKDFEKAITVFKELLGLAPQSDKILYYLGAIHQELERFESAIDYFARIPTSSGLYQDSSFQMANMLSALAQLEHAQTGKDGAAVAKFLRVVQSKIAEIPDLVVELRVLEAGFYEATEREALAVQSLRLIEKEKNFSIQHQYYLAGLLEKLKDFEASTAIIMAILDKDPKNAHAWNFLGYSMLERGTPPEEALPYIQKALALSPDDGYIRDSLGWYYFKTGRVKEALTELTFAFSKVPDDVVIAKHLALIHKDMRNFSKARTYLQHALKLARIRSEIDDLKTVLDILDGERVPASAD